MEDLKAFEVRRRETSSLLRGLRGKADDYVLVVVCLLIGGWRVVDWILGWGG